MRKLKREEAILFVVPLAFVPLALVLARAKQQSAKAPRSPRLANFGLPSTPRAEAEAIKSILPSRDGRVLFTDGWVHGSPGIHLWDARTDRHLRTIKTIGQEPGEKLGLRLSPDSRTTFYAAASASTAFIVDARTGATRARIHRRDGENFCDAAINNQVLAHSRGSSVALRSLNDGGDAGRVAARPKAFPAYLTFSPDGSLLTWVSGARSALRGERTSRTYGVQTHEVVVCTMKNKRLATLPLGECVVFAVSISGDNSKLAVLVNRRPAFRAGKQAGKDVLSSLSNRVLVFNLKSGRQIYEKSLSPLATTALAISPDGRWLAFKNAGPEWGGTSWLQVADLSTSTHRPVTLEQHPSHAIAFSADSRTLFTHGEIPSFKLQPDGQWKASR